MTESTKFQAVTGAIKRFRESDPEHASRVKKRRFSRGYPSKIESRLTSLASTIFPATLEEKPAEETLDKIDAWVTSCMPSLRVRSKFLEQIQAFDLHPDIIARFRNRQFNPEEEKLFIAYKKAVTQKKSKKAVNRAEFYAHLLCLYEFAKTSSQNAWTCGKQLSLFDATTYCNVKCRRDRFVLLKLTGSKHTEKELKKAIKVREQHRTEFRKLIKCHNGPKKGLPFTLYLKCLQSIGSPKEAAANLSPEEILQGLSQIGKGKRKMWILYKQAFTAMGREDLVDYLNAHGDINLTGITHQQIVEKKSQWHRKLVQEMRKFEALQSQGRSAFPELNLKALQSEFCKLLLFLDDYVTGKNLEAPKLKTFLRGATLNDIEEMLRAKALLIKSDNEKVKSRIRTHQAQLYVSRYLRFFKGTLRNHLGCAQEIHNLSVKNVLRGVPNTREVRDANFRRSYTDDEVERLMLCTKDPAEDVLLTLMSEVALRTTAMAHIKYDQLVTKTHTPQTEMKILEKGNKYRCFISSPRLQSKIKALSDFLRANFSDAEIKDCYPLNLANIQNPRGRASFSDMMKRLGTDAGITGIHVHVHAFRHSFVENYLKAGNSLETVSKLLGHQSLHTTNNRYFVPTAKALAETVIHPFASGYKRPAEIENENDDANQKPFGDSKVKTAMILNTTLDECMKKCVDAATYAKVNQMFHERLPDAKEMIDIINQASETCSSTTTTTINN